ncbi:ABC transporter ATP-binding protein [Desulfonatronovibrio hydrogenovorans]|uniref:ABC transporter ATP-binding protein n=1 Tax=Desulfonatronovibrio hydrogenovorans TaxID=53245 RepID=UPI000691837A|nr:ATP-binding cassette domain-containing protein [Desulfonatronovibrio hydrogenovorans]
MSLYELKDLKQVFGNRTVLDIEHLHLDAGGSYALLGPNGSGKTTLLHILAFLKPPFSGQLFFSGQQVQWKEKYLYPLRRRVVLVDQHPIMFSTTVLKNVEYGPKMRGLSQDNRSRLAVESLELVGMKEFAHRPAHLLSGGETQRVAIARAIACQPEVMLFDEPTASVDVENQALIERVVQDIRNELGISIIFSTHKRLEAARLSQEKVFMFEGRLSGPGGENLLTGNIVHENDQPVCILGDHVKLKVETGIRGRCRVFVRPEMIRISDLRQDQRVSSNSVHTGKIQQMTAEDNQIKVLLDVGFPIRTILTPQDVADKRFLVGDEVRVEFEEGAVEVG